MRRLLNLLRGEIVLSVSLLLAVVSMFFVPPDSRYLSYIDWRTLAILLCLMSVMQGLQQLGVFRMIGGLLIRRVSSLRALTLVLTGLCFFFSMFITNDVALLTFVPFTLVVLELADQRRLLIPVIVLQTIAANLGSMLMPMGNPQNLYLYSLSGLSLPDFVLLMLPYAALSLIGLAVCCLLMTPRGSLEAAAVSAGHEEGGVCRTPAEKRLLVLHLALFLLALLVVVRVLAWYICLGLTCAALLVFDRRSIRKADYSLLLTFIFLFVFIGNMKRIPAVSAALQTLVSGREVLTSVLASQVISNVPAAILLSGFTDRLEGLIIGTDLGGLGTLIASMASLISFKQYSHAEGADRKRYFLLFTGLNLVFLAALLLEARLLHAL